jgi:hypothetical protein
MAATAEREKIVKELASSWLVKQRTDIKYIHMDDDQCKRLLCNITIYLASVEISAREEEKLARSKHKIEKELIGGEDLIRRFNAMLLSRTEPDDLGVGVKAFTDILAYIKTMNIRGAELVSYCATLFQGIGNNKKKKFKLDNAQHISSVTDRLCEVMHEMYGRTTARRMVQVVCAGLSMDIVSDPQKRQESAEDIVMEAALILKEDSLVMDGMDMQTRKGFLVFLAGCGDWSIVKEYETEDPVGYNEWLNDTEATKHFNNNDDDQVSIDDTELERLLFKTIQARMIVYILTKLTRVTIREWCSRLDVAHGSDNKPSISKPSEQALNRLGVDYQVWHNASIRYSKQAALDEQ